ERHERRDRVAREELQDGRGQERDDDEHRRELDEAPNDEPHERVLLARGGRSAAALDPDLVDGMPDPGTLVFLGAAEERRTLRATDHVDLAAGSDRPLRPVAPQVPQLLGEFTVQILVYRLALRRVRLAAALLEVLVDDGVDDAPEVHG